MKFVVDTNILITFFWKDSFTKGLLLDQNLEFFAPEYSLEEINRNFSEIIKKTGISLDEFKILRKDLAICVEFIPLEEYLEFLKNAFSIQNKEDIDFIALALKLKLPIWSNDKQFKKQKLVKTFTTRELVKLISSKD